MIDFVDIQPGYRTDYSCVVLFLRWDKSGTKVRQKLQKISNEYEEKTVRIS